MNSQYQNQSAGKKLFAKVIVGTSLLAGSVCIADPEFNTDFPGGNGKLLSVDADRRIVRFATEAKGAKNYYFDKDPTHLNSARYFRALPNCRQAFTLEFGYGLCGGLFSRAAARELGHNTFKAIGRTLGAGGVE